MIQDTGLIDKLRAEQGTLSDYEFAKNLGISHQLWQMTRSGKREIGLVVLKGIVRAYSKLHQDVLLFLSGDANILNLADNNLTERHQRTPSQNLRGLIRKLIAKVKRLFQTDISIGD